MSVQLLNTSVGGLSKRYRDKLAEGGEAAAYVEVLDPNGNVIASTSETSTVQLLVDDGGVSVSGHTAIARSYDCVVVDPTGDLNPREATDLLHPLSGNEIRLYRGFEFGPDDAELIMLVTAGIVSAPTTWRSDEGLHIALSGQDRSGPIRRRRLTSPWTVPKGENYVDEIMRLILARYPQAQFRATARRHKTPLLVFDEQDDPWDHAVKMASSIGFRLYADVDGVFVLEPEPNTTDPDVAVAWAYSDGEASTTLGIDVDRSSEGVYSGVIATGENPSLEVPVRGEAWDDNENCPTYRKGTFGEVPYFMVSQYIETPEQAEDAAQGNLQRVIGLSERASLEALVNAAHRPSDVVSIEHELAGVSAAFVLDEFTVPLREASTTYETRERFLA